nr:hypothetical protein [Tanacetum cinerariifolium]
GVASEWFTKECIGTISTRDDLVKRFVLKFYNICDHEETEDNNNPDVIDNVPEIFKINDDLFKFDSPLCVAFEESNHLLKTDHDLFTYKTQKIKTYDKYEQELSNKTQGLEEPWSENGVPYQLCDHVCEPYRFKNGGAKWPTCASDIDGFCNGGELPGMSYFENFHELDNEVLLKLEKCWWKVNTHEIAPFARRENFGWGPYANIKTEWASNPYLDANRIFGRDYEASNIGCTQENHEHKGNLIPEPSNCKVGRFKMMKYSFTNNKEYIIVKESEYLNHSKGSLDAYQELLRLINEGWVVTTPGD